MTTRRGFIGRVIGAVAGGLAGARGGLADESPIFPVVAPRPGVYLIMCAVPGLEMECSCYQELGTEALSSGEWGPSERCWRGEFVGADGCRFLKARFKGQRKQD